MPFSFHKEITTPEALASSIDTDQHVLRWFTLLVVQPAVRAREMKEPHIQCLYVILKRVILSQYLLYLFIAGGALALIYLQHYSYLGWGLFFIVPTIYLHQRLKQCVREIGMDLVHKDFEPKILCQKTLYQICEFYSQQYHIPSLVDNIFQWDNTTRNILIVSAVLSIQMISLLLRIHQVNFVLTLISLLGICYFIFMFINAFVLYRYLRVSSLKNPS